MDSAKQDTSGDPWWVGATEEEKDHYIEWWTSCILGPEVTNGLGPRIYGSRRIDELKPAPAAGQAGQPYAAAAQGDDADPEYLQVLRDAEEEPARHGSPAVPPRYVSPEATSFIPGEDPEE